MNPFTDKYFTKAKEVAMENEINPVVKYRVFGRFAGVAALEPAKLLIEILSPRAIVKILPTGTLFKIGDTIMTIEGEFQYIVELETLYLQWCALPCYCAHTASSIVLAAKGKEVLDFSARHLFGAESVALASYGASVGGIGKFSTDVGANAYDFLKHQVWTYHDLLDSSFQDKRGWIGEGVGTIPHALIALFYGDYKECAWAYRKAFPNEKQIHLIDYNNREIDDSLQLLSYLGYFLKAVRIDTCGENFAQGTTDSVGTISKGVTVYAVKALRKALDKNGGKHVEIIVSSGFDVTKTGDFMDAVPDCFSTIGTGSFIPKVPQCTSDIFEVDGRKECKVGREWGYTANTKFDKEVTE